MATNFIADDVAGVVATHLRWWLYFSLISGLLLSGQAANDDYHKGAVALDAHDYTAAEKYLADVPLKTPP